LKSVKRGSGIIDAAPFHVSDTISSFHLTWHPWVYKVSGMDSFKVRITRQTRYVEKYTYMEDAMVFHEPAEAADYAENELRRCDPGSHGEILFNGDTEPHTVIFVMPESTGKQPVFGVWNTDSALWPLFYPTTPGGSMLSNPPDDYTPPSDSADDDEGQTEIDQDADKLDLGAEENENDEEFEDDSDEESEEDDGPDEEDDSAERDDDEDEPDDTNDDEEDESENDESDAESDPDDEDDEEADVDSDSEVEEEKEVMRLPIFAKMRGPKGWRKRAEAEELYTRNVFALKVGILDPTAGTPGRQEQNVVAHVEFIESDDSRKAGLLRLTLPDGITLEDFKQTKNGKITVEVPYGD
jgi:hypothetical protein